MKATGFDMIRRWAGTEEQIWKARKAISKEAFEQQYDHAGATLFGGFLRHVLRETGLFRKREIALARYTPDDCLRPLLEASEWNPGSAAASEGIFSLCSSGLSCHRDKLVGDAASTRRTQATREGALQWEFIADSGNANLHNAGRPRRAVLEKRRANETLKSDTALSSSSIVRHSSCQ